MSMPSRPCLGVACRILGVFAFIALAFISGCTTAGSGSTQFAVTTTSASLPAGSSSTGEVYPSTALAVSGGTAPYTWTITSGNLPAGLSLSSAGMVISGTVTSTDTAGVYNFTVQVTDSATTKNTATANLSITINPKVTVTTSGTLGTVGELRIGVLGHSCSHWRRWHPHVGAKHW